MAKPLGAAWNVHFRERSGEIAKAVWEMALVIAGMMTVGAASVVMAENYTISTENKKHTYEIYQVFTGTADGNTLTDLFYGQNSPNYVSGANTAVSQSDIEALKTISEKNYGDDDQAKIDDLTPFVTLSNPIARVTGSGAEGTVSSASVPEGYYVIKDVDNSLSDPETYTLYLFSVIGEDTTITPKAGTVEHEKHVDDQNDSNATDASALKDSADYDIGDHVPYTLTATLPENYSDYESYYLQFVDDMSAGLTLDADSVKIFYGASDNTGTAITLTSGGTSTHEGGTVYTYTIADLKTVADLDDEDVITIKYTATLNSSAVVGSTGNPNEYKLVYSNNPNNSGEGKPTNETPWHKNIVFTYKAVFNKVDGEGNALTGADFTLYKKVVDADAEDGYVWVDVTKLNGEGATNPTKTVTDADDVEDAIFAFSGLDAGDYKLEETTVPTGYNGIADIEFTITASHDLVSNDPQLTALATTGGLTLTGDLASGKVETDIENNSGATLPSTGGIGTTIFYVLGAILVLGAAVLLVTKKRVSAE